MGHNVWASERPLSSTSSSRWHRRLRDIQVHRIGLGQVMVDVLGSSIGRVRTDYRIPGSQDKSKRCSASLPDLHSSWNNEMARLLQLCLMLAFLRMVCWSSSPPVLRGVKKYSPVFLPHQTTAASRNEPSLLQDNLEQILSSFSTLLRIFGNPGGLAIA